MPNVVNVRFRNRGKSYYFDPGELTPEEGAGVVVETSKGLELGECVEGVHEVPEERIVPPLRPVVRLATAEDLRVAELNRKREKSAFTLCEERIRAHGLDMKLVDVEYAFEGGKILFFFTSDGRVDFRELVKDLAGLFHTRIELRQIGVRDGAKLLGGLGICGRPFCCSTFLEEFQPVSIKMAKTQNLSLNPTKISGTCGRLMCCLKYEQEAYEHLIKTLPKAEASVDTPKGKGTVTEVNLLRRTVKVRLADSADNSVQTYPVDRLGYTLNGEYIEPKPEEAAPAVSDLPDLSLYAGDQPGRLGNRLAEALMEPKPAEKKEGRSRSRRKNRGGERKDRPQEAGAPAGEKKKPAEGEKKFEKKQESRPRPPKNQNRPQNAGPKAQAAAEKAEGGEKKHGNYHRRYFHRGNKKPGGAPKSEG
ncbi:MAG: hypothetical protein IKP17_00745 [Oscillospiraceae bacterium]|nr:hypothetical protein [Oscillospiraceae bacterium]